MKKTNAMRILDSAKIEYEALEYVDNTEHELEKGAAVETAKKLGIAIDSVFKTIVMRTDSKEICVFCVSANDEVNLKKARAVTLAKEISPIKPNELCSITGYVRGGCSPLGMKKKFRTFIDSKALTHKKIHISGGVRGCQISISPLDLIKVADMKDCDLVL